MNFDRDLTVFAEKKEKAEKDAEVLKNKIRKMLGLLN